jgi:transcriptional regulator with XRE-family HTH domain
MKKWTQAQLARAAKVSVNTVGRIEARGVRNPRVYVKIRRALGVSEEELQQWIAARPIDKRLLQLVVWFEQLAAKDQDLVGQVLILLLNRRTNH